MNKAIYGENIRRYWMVSFAGSLVYFLVGPLSIIFGSNENSYGYSVIASMYTWTLPLCYIIPAVFAQSVFSYLFKSSSCSVMHAMPLSRKRLFLTNYFSGLYMSLVPAVFAFVAMAASRVAVIAYGVDSEKVFSLWSLESWFVETCTIVTYVFSVCVLAAMVSGNGVISALTGIGFNALIPLFASTVLLYADTFLFGFAYTDSYSEFIINLHPGLKAFESLILESSDPFLIQCPVYLAIAAVVSVFGYFLYSKRKLENAGDSYVFNTAKSIIGILITFFASSLTGILFFDLYGSNFGYVAFAVAAVVGFIISRMIISRSSRIINLQSLKEFCITAVIVSAIISVFLFDVFGYEKNTPDPTNVLTAEVDCVYYNSALVGSNTMIFSEKESIEEIVNLQKTIINAGENNDSTETYAFNVCYSLKNGNKIKRHYSVDEEVLKAYDTEKLFSSKEFTEAAEKIAKIDTNIIREFYVDGPYVNGSLKNSDAETKELLSCISKDMLTRLSKKSIDDDPSEETIYISITCTTSDKDLLEELKRTGGYESSYTYTESPNGKFEETTVYFLFYMTEKDQSTWSYVNNVIKEKGLIPDYKIDG